jgi:hypothetical protein
VTYGLRLCNIWGKQIPHGEAFLVNEDAPADPEKGVAVDTNLVVWVMNKVAQGWTVMAKDILTGTAYRIAGPSLSCDPAAPAVNGGLVVWGCRSGGDGGPFGWRAHAP